MCKAPEAFPFERDSYASTALGDVVDRSLHAAVSRLTAGLSPAALAEAYFDWATHLASAPGKQSQLLDKAFRKAVRLGHHASRQLVAQGGTSEEPCIEPLPQDRRFASEAWQKWPYSFIYQSFLLQQQWWHNATTGVRGVTAQHERVIEFASRQLLDMLSPANFIPTNPEVLNKTVDEAGMNLVRGYQNFLEDWQRSTSGAKPVGSEKFAVGGNIAVSPGKVIYRNRLIELIQYAPTTAEVRPEPILVIPAWIMKYYILDLSPHNSLVRYLTSQGFTVFMVSWKNPDPDDRDLGMEDYLMLGVMAAFDAIGAVVPQRKVHAVGYCLGGTLLSIAAAAMARDGDERLRSMTLLAAQTDFTEAGELMLFINESQLSFLEDTMWEQGFLDTRQMAGAFQLLRSNDLIWSRMVHDYLMGEREPMSDLMAWNADATRMPYRMHSEYLRRLFLENDLAEGRFGAGSRPVVLTDIRVPIFAVGTVRDHVAPWRSVFKIHLLTDTEVTFLLTSGGHNAGIVSEPGHNGRSYQVATKSADERYADPDTWTGRVPTRAGSWWPELAQWLAARSGAPVAPPPMGAAASGYAPLADAPGSYVRQE
ncbi:MAG: PHA/PHB synthase family protein [Hyphomicrobium sp.]|uniref:PHA/PHB synthase family protein n=1 Tax=Hyphomicrobium sp. TaxID=82 RepID=UPI003D0F8AF3